MLGGGEAGLPQRPARNSVMPGGQSSPGLICACSCGPPGPPRPRPDAGCPPGAGAVPAGGDCCARTAALTMTASPAVHTSPRELIAPPALNACLCPDYGSWFA